MGGKIRAHTRRRMPYPPAGIRCSVHTARKMHGAPGHGTLAAGRTRTFACVRSLNRENWENLLEVLFFNRRDSMGSDEKMKHREHRNSFMDLVRS